MARKVTTEEVASYMLKYGCTLLSEYSTMKTKIEYVCSCGNKNATTTFDSFKASVNKRCGECRRSISVKRREKTTAKGYYEVVQFFKSKNCIVVTEMEDYKNKKSQLEYICECGDADVVSYNKFCKRKYACIHRKEIRFPKKRTEEDVFKIFEEENCKINEENYEYVNDFQKISFVCKCNRIGSKTIRDFIEKPQCIQCSFEDNGLRCRTSFEELISVFNSFGCVLLSREYKNERAIVDYLCICGSIHSEKFSVIRDREMCKECSLIAKNRKRYIEWSKYFEEYGCVLLTTECKRSDQDIKYICECGRVSITQQYRFAIGQRCMECRNERYRRLDSGTATLRNSREYKLWRRNVYVRDKETCQCCYIYGEDVILHAHHIYNFLNYEDIRYEESNGILLCSQCHFEFHSEYTSYNNDIFQLQEYFDDIHSHLGLPLVSIEDIVSQSESSQS